MSQANGYEKKDVNVIKVVIPVVASVLFLILAGVALDQYFDIATEKMYFEKVLKPESAELKELRDKETSVLTSYKVIDEAKGVYQIPIERAMELEVLEHAK